MKEPMKAEPPAQPGGSGTKSLLKTAGLVAALGLGTWLLAPILLPVKVPEDFPKTPELQTLNPSMRTLLQEVDKEARRKPGSIEAVGKLAMAYHANELMEPAAQAYKIAERLAPNDFQWAYAHAVLQEENGDEKEQVRLLQQTLRLKPDHVPALLKMADWYFKLGRLDEAARSYELAAKAPEGGASLQANFGLGRVAARRKEWDKVIAYAEPLVRSHSHVLPPYELLQEAYGALGQPDRAAAAKRGSALTTWKAVPAVEDPLNEQLAGLCYSPTRLLKHAGLLSRLGYPTRSLQAARRALEAAPADPDVRNFLARTLLTFYAEKPDAIDEALTQLSECLRLRPDDLSPLWLFSSDFLSAPKPPAAVARLHGLMRPHANLPEAHFYLGLVADAEGNAAEAVAQYQAALKVNPTDSSVYNKLGLILDHAGKLDEAVAHFQKSIQLNPANTGARLNLGIALMQRGSYPQAAKEFGELLRLDPHDAAAHFSMGFAYLYSKRVDDAVAKFREGLQYKPGDPDAHYGLASALAAQRKREEAAAEVREALKLRPDYPAAQELLQQLGYPLERP